MTNTRQVASFGHEDDELDAIGLPAADSQVYATLVRHPRAAATELAEHSGLSVQQVGRALGRLTAGGMASRAPGRPARYLAVAPDVALGALVARKEAELRGARARVHGLMEVFREASRFTHPAELVEVVTGVDNISRRVSRMQDAAHEQIRGFDKPPYVRDPGDNLGEERRRLAEGIRYRVIYDREAVAWPGRMASDILVGVAQGEHARVRPELPMKMFLSDDTLAVIPISSSSHAVDAAYVIHPSALLDALATLFEAEWARAVPLTVDTARDDGPDEPTAAMLALLAAGQTDAGIARSLGWSPRTTQRRVRLLLADLGATTRFQAGMRARERGWL